MSHTFNHCERWLMCEQRANSLKLYRIAGAPAVIPGLTQICLLFICSGFQDLQWFFKFFFVTSTRWIIVILWANQESMPEFAKPCSWNKPRTSSEWIHSWGQSNRESRICSQLVRDRLSLLPTWEARGKSRSMYGKRLMEISRIFQDVITKNY